MTTIPIFGTDSLSNYPSVKPHPRVTLSSSKLHNRQWRLNKDNWPAEDVGNLHGVTTRSVSVSAVPILRRQMRNAATRSNPRPEVLKSSDHSPKSSPGFSGYYEDTSQYILYDFPPRYALTNNCIKDLAPVYEMNPQSVESNFQSPHPPFTNSAPQPRRPRRLDSSYKGFPTISAVSDVASVSIARKPVASTPTTSGVVDDHISNTVPKSAFQDIRKHMSQIPNVAGIQDTSRSPKCSIESTQDKSAPPTPSPQPRSVPSQSTSGMKSGFSNESVGMTYAAGAPLNQGSFSSQESLVLTHHGMTETQKDKNTASFVIVFDPFPYFFSMFNFTFHAITAENLQTARDLGLLCMKTLIFLYVAACLWNVITAIHEAVLKAFEPVIVFLGFLNWVFGE